MGTTLTIYRTLTQNDNFHVIMGEHTKTYKKSIGVDKGKRTFPMNNKVLALIKNILSSKIDNINGILFWDYKKDFYITPCEINSYLKRINEKYQIISDVYTSVSDDFMIKELQKMS